MADSDCPINGINCVSINRVESTERSVESLKESNSRTHEKIYDRLGSLERDVATLTTQYSNIIDRLATISADLNAIKEKPAKRYENIVNSVMQWLVLAVLGAVVVFK